MIASASPSSIAEQSTRAAGIASPVLRYPRCLASCGADGVRPPHDKLLEPEPTRESRIENAQNSFVRNTIAAGIVKPDATRTHQVGAHERPAEQDGDAIGALRITGMGRPWAHL